MSSGRRSFLAGLPLAGALATPLGAAATAAAAQGPGSDSLEQRLFGAFDAMQIADTHEHLLDERDRIQQRIDFFSLIGHYAIGDAISAGMTGEALRVMQNKEASDVERWRALLRHL